MSSNKSPRTPGGGSQKGKVSSAPKTPAGAATSTPTNSSSASSASPRHSMKLPENFDAKEVTVLVYEKKGGSGNATTTTSGKINNVPGKKQGVWQDGYQAAVSPTQLWAFLYENAPENVEGSRHIHGVWGLNPNSFSPGEALPDLHTLDPSDVWFYSPRAKIPKYFVPRGIWTFPLIKKDITQLNPEEAGFLHVGDSVKNHKLDVGGSWKMLYRRDGLPEAPIGPGMSPRKAPKPAPAAAAAPPKSPKPKVVAKEKPKTLTVYVRSPGSDSKIPISNLLPTATVQELKGRIEEKEGTPRDEQRLKFHGKDLDDNDDNDDDPNKKSLDACGIKDGDVIDIDGITVYVEKLLPTNATHKTLKSPQTATTKLEFTNLPPQTTIDELKDKIASHPTNPVPRQHQRLTHKGRPLTNDSKSLKDLGIVHKSTLHLDPMQITVKTPQGQSVPLQVEPTDTILNVKQQVQDKTGIPVDEQRLVFDGKPLDDDNDIGKTIEDCGIQHGDTVELDGMRIQVKDWKNNIFEIDVDPTNTIDQVKDKIRDQQKIPKNLQRLSFQGKLMDKDYNTLRDYGIKHKSMLLLEPMVISVQTPQGKIIDLQVDPNDTVQNVKRKIQQKEGIPVDEQYLTYNDKILGDGTTLIENRIQHGSTLVLEPMQLYVTDPKGKRFVLEGIVPEDTVEDIKNKIQDQENIPKSQQRLTFQGKPLKDKDTMRDLGIKHKSTLNLEPMEIKVRLPSGKDVKLIVDPNDTTQDVKLKLRDKEGIPVDDQRLEFQGEPMKDGTTLADMGIIHGDIIDAKPMEIFIREPNGNQFPVQVDPTNTIQDVKKKISSQANIPEDQQRLAFKGKPLNKDTKTLQSCGIKHHSTLDLEPMTIHVETQDGKRIPLQVDPSDTIADVKDKLEEQEHISVEDQSVMFQGKELPVTSTLQDNNVKHGDTIQLSSMQILVVDWKRKSMTLDVRPSDTIASIRMRIEEVKDIRPHQQILSFQDTMLDNNDNSLQDYGIQNQSIINLDCFKISVQVVGHGKFTMEMEPSWKVKRIKQAVEARFKMKADMQEPKFDGNKIEDNSTLQECGIKYKDTVIVEEINIPEYDVHIGPWQDPFNYKPKSPHKKREGVRRKTTHDRSADYFAEGKKDNALNVDIWSDKKGEK